MILIRSEKEQEYEQIYQLVKKAFLTAKISDGSEQDLVTKLRLKDKYINNLALVAEYDKQIVGHIMLTKFNLTLADKAEYETLLLAPISVMLEHRNKGIGSMLIKKSLDEAKKLKYKSVFLCGDPNYYQKFGFKNISYFQIENKSSIPTEYILAYELENNALSKVEASIDFEQLK